DETSFLQATAKHPTQSFYAQPPRPSVVQLYSLYSDLLERGWVAGAPAHDLGLGSAEVDHSCRFGAAVAGVDHRVDRVVEPLLDLPTLRQRFRLVRQQQRGGQQRLVQLGEQRLRDGVLRDPHSDGLLLRAQQDRKSVV